MKRIIVGLVLCCSVVALVKGSPYFLLDNFDEWNASLIDPCGVEPTDSGDWSDYVSQWSDPCSLIEGDPYPNLDPARYYTPTLYVADPSGDPLVGDDEGLVMTWGPSDGPSSGGDWASAFKYIYEEDPDLRNCTIKVTVTPPCACNISAVSFAIIDAAGRQCSWWWKVQSTTYPAPNFTLPCDLPTQVTINTSQLNLNSTNPPADGFMMAPGFRLDQAVTFQVDENSNWNFPAAPVPPPNQPQFMGMWNYWHDLIVVPNNEAYKTFWTKWKQGPVVLNEGEFPPEIEGWDELSWASSQDPTIWLMVADDWRCTDDRPVTDIHWWGSFFGWTQPTLPSGFIMPDRFHIGIWTDTPVGGGVTYSHPDQLIWENYCDSYVWNFAGYDVDPRPEATENEACFQFNQLLSEDEWFHQDPGSPDGTIYWISITAIYDRPRAEVVYPWGWKTRRPHDIDDAVRIQDLSGSFPPAIGDKWTGGVPIELNEESWDLAFELTTNDKEPGKCYEHEGDINHDCIVDLVDYSLLADDWLKTSIP